ncbi:gamma-type small acid-soluble spore protein [Ectobacillus ponti]|uniref:Small, acid-soluble spore protein gamma-type n=1 Tax=Ectobacillus ponti TaxID=2961894 RepID=A0AA42BUX1_9BACI|nr:gamma-type small acid-soluble spore protein [Ectobacillus ponti]MCP8970978.1 gamma-type small acid-soluble spore protein [Ectobacillus ponti]
MNNNQQQKNFGKTASGTSVQHVKQSNAGYGAEFSVDTTDVQHVKQQNQQAEAKKAQNSGQFGSQSQQ